VHETANDALRRLGKALPDSGVVVLGDLAAALLRGSDIDQGVYAARKFAMAADARPNTMGRARAQIVAARLPSIEHELAHHLERLAT
jgi:hypothetical protein